ncbi:hypothetical protein, partial [Arthrobacter sp. DR-2P]
DRHPAPGSCPVGGDRALARCAGRRWIDPDRPDPGLRGRVRGQGSDRCVAVRRRRDLRGERDQPRPRGQGDVADRPDLWRGRHGRRVRRGPARRAHPRPDPAHRLRHHDGGHLRGHAPRPEENERRRRRAGQARTASGQGPAGRGRRRARHRPGGRGRRIPRSPGPGTAGRPADVRGCGHLPGGHRHEVLRRARRIPHHRPARLGPHPQRDRRSHHWLAHRLQTRRPHPRSRPAQSLRLVRPGHGHLRSDPTGSGGSAPDHRRRCRGPGSGCGRDLLVLRQFLPATQQPEPHPKRPALIRL